MLHEPDIAALPAWPLPPLPEEPLPLETVPPDPLPPWPVDEPAPDADEPAPATPDAEPLRLDPGSPLCGTGEPALAEPLDCESPLLLAVTEFTLPLLGGGEGAVPP